MTPRAKNEDAELTRMLSALADEGRLAGYIADLLSRADVPDIEINGVLMSLRGPSSPASDKSCYKKCLKEDIEKPGSYKECIKKCRPKAHVGIDFSGIVV